MKNNSEKIVTRFAPSPTGFLHIGGARTALFAYLWARKNNGTFILRIEDTDKEREVAGSVEQIIETLGWLGIDFDYGPEKPGPFGSCIQSERLDTHREFAQKLIDKGLAYPDPYTQEELEGFREKAKMEKRPFLFRDHRPEKFEKWDGSKPLRFKVSEIKRYKWHDEVRGDLEAGEDALDDFILIKSDGYPTYNFAHIVDDYFMGVTHVMRGDEYISSMPRFLSLYDALEIKYPIFATLPPILREDKTKKLSKRDGVKDILEYRAEGFLPEAFINFLAFIGWNPGTEQEIFSRDELKSAFELGKIQKAGAVFNEIKLLWLNHEWIKKMPANERNAKIKTIIGDFNPSFSLSDEVVAKIAHIVIERVQKWGDLKIMLESGELDYFFTMPKIENKEKLVWRDEKDFINTLEYLTEVIKKLSNTDAKNWNTSDELKNIIWDYATEKGRGAVLWPIRYALTGKDKSPDPFVVASILGKEETIKRLESAIALF
ncbi:glutamate--tRNA ligase [Candidatus Parcubacteria bacterium]|nr:glutamate--tRNA ligase [Candidatus Parcubacteria bacterium]